MEEKKDNRGGVRIGAGRNKLPIGDKKVQVKFWIENKYLFTYGGLKKATDLAKETLMNGNNPISERNIQDLTQPTHQIKPITDAKPTSSVIVNTLPPKPLISLYNSFRDEISKATSSKQMGEIMNRVKAEAMLPRDKMALEAYAKEVSVDFYTD